MATLGVNYLTTEDFFSLIRKGLGDKLNEHPIKEATIDLGVSDGFVRLKQQYPTRKVLTTNKIT